MKTPLFSLFSTLRGHQVLAGGLCPVLVDFLPALRCGDFFHQGMFGGEHDVGSPEHSVWAGREDLDHWAFGQQGEAQLPAFAPADPVLLGLPGAP